MSAFRGYDWCSFRRTPRSRWELLSRLAKLNHIFSLLFPLKFTNRSYCFSIKKFQASVKHTIFSFSFIMQKWTKVLIILEYGTNFDVCFFLTFLKVFRISGTKNRCTEQQFLRTRLLLAYFLAYLLASLLASLASYFT